MHSLVRALAARKHNVMEKMQVRYTIIPVVPIDNVTWKFKVWLLEFTISTIAHGLAQILLP